MNKILLIITLSLSIANIYGQGWTTCGTTSGKLSGTLTHITINQSTTTPIYDTLPSPTGTIPQNDFLIVLHDSLAFDSLGNTIISSNNNGIINPSSLGLIANDTVSIVSLSYDIQQFKLLTQGILTNFVAFVGSCCDMFDTQMSLGIIPGVCDSLNNIGIQDSSDVNTIQDVINIVSIYKYGTIKPLSLRGLNNGLINISAVLSTVNPTGCTNGVGELCYAFDSISTNHDQYVLVQSGAGCQASFNYADSNCIVYFNNNSTGATSYLWYFGDGNQSTLQNPTHTYSSSGTYNVTLNTIDSNGVYCDSISQNVFVNCSITDIADQDVPKLKLFPTYIDQNFTIEISGNIHSTYSVDIINMLGKSIYRSELKQNKTIIQRNDIPSGVYLLQLYNGRYGETHKVLFK